MSVGAAVWLAVGAASLAWVAITTLAGPRRLPGGADVVRWFLRSWLGRFVALALWAEAGWHLLTQRP